MDDSIEPVVGTETTAIQTEETKDKAPSRVRKSWQDYLFEFTVPFLAVTAAFILNSERESYQEHQLEKQYLSSMVEDLKLDTASMNNRKKFIQLSLRKLDTLILYLSNPKPETAYKIYNTSSGFLYAGPIFRANDRTLQQLKNTGGLRLIRDRNISNQIITYDRKIIENIVFQEEAIDRARTDCKELFGEIFKMNSLINLYEGDFHPLPPESKIELITQDPIVINRFLSRIFALRLVYSNADKNTYKAGIDYAEEVMESLRKEIKQ